MSNYTEVFFDGLGVSFNIPSVAFTIGSYEVHWYGIIIAFGFALAVLYGGRTAYKWKMSLDGMTDVLIWGTLFGIVGARLYYVAFEWDYFSQNPGEIIAIWHGGIAIYGGIIGALIGGWIGAKIGKIDFANLLDVGALGLLIRRFSVCGQPRYVMSLPQIRRICCKRAWRWIPMLPFTQHSFTKAFGASRCF